MNNSVLTAEIIRPLYTALNARLFGPQQVSQSPCESHRVSPSNYTIKNQHRMLIPLQKTSTYKIIFRLYYFFLL